MSKSCRICDSVLFRTHSVALFSRESLASDLANRLSKVADVPVASEDGLSRFICIPCKNKLMSGEYFRTTAKATYEKNKDPTLTASGSNSQVQVINKRTKDSSGPGASPQTRQCRPGAKRLTPEHPGRRLTYPDCDSCKTKHELIVHVLVSLAGTPLLCNPDTWSTIRETSGEITRTTLRSTCGTVVRFNLKSNKNGTSWKQIDFP